MSHSDFNNDGFDDLAIGAPGEDIGTVAGAGAINALFGSVGGLDDLGNQIWEQNSSGILGAAENGDGFGSAVASGDFNNDGFDDLAVGAPGEDIGTIAGAGAVNMLRGSAGGLTATNNQIWEQNSSGIFGAAENGDGFGSALAVGDFNNDGFEDLAVGAPGEDIGTVAGAGAVNMLRGSAAGLTATNNQIWEQNSSGIFGAAENGDGFGSALAVGDFDNDGFDDLAVGAPGEDIGTVAGAGAVNMLRGSAAGLTATNNQIWEQNSSGILGAAENGDGFGSALAVGDFNNDGFEDLAVGAPGEDIGTIAGAGAVNVLLGSTGGLDDSGDQIWEQNSSGILGAAENGDGFGSAVASGDFNNDGFDDLAIGAPGEDIGTVAGAGSVNVLLGSASGLDDVGDQIWEQNSPGVLGGAENFDFFGSALAVGDYNSDGFDDLVIGASGEDIGTVASAGAANVLFGSANGLTANNTQIWEQNSAGILGAAETDDLFGFALA